VYSPGGDFILSAGSGDWILRWNTKTGNYSRFLEAGSKARAAISADGRYVAVADHNLTVHQLDSPEGQDNVCYFTREAEQVAFSPCGHWMASGDSNGIVSLRNLPLTEGATEGARELEGHEDAIEQVKFSPNGRWLISLCLNMVVCLWDTESAECIEEFHFSGSCVSFSPCGGMLAVVDDDSVRVWDLHRKKDVIFMKGQDAFPHLIS